MEKKKLSKFVENVTIGFGLKKEKKKNIQSNVFLLYIGMLVRICQ